MRKLTLALYRVAVDGVVFEAGKLFGGQERAQQARGCGGGGGGRVQTGTEAETSK